MGHLKQRFSEFVVGLMFGVGLIISGMTDPGKVLAFLDPFGSWDPSLAFVMGGAIAVGFFAFSIAKRWTISLLGDAIHLPTSNQIDKRLIGGALLFGTGWGLAGFCPGPGIVSMASGEIKAAAFVGSLILGMALYEMVEHYRHKAHSVPPLDSSSTYE